MTTSDVISPAVFAVFWLMLIRGVLAERERAKGARR